MGNTASTCISLGYGLLYCCKLYDYDRIDFGQTFVSHQCYRYYGSPTGPCPDDFPLEMCCAEGFWWRDILEEQDQDTKHDLRSNWTCTTLGKLTEEKLAKKMEL